MRGAVVGDADAGAVPYLSDWWTLDLVGLNDAHIALAGKLLDGWKPRVSLRDGLKICYEDVKSRLARAAL